MFGEDLERLPDTTFCFLVGTDGRAPLNCFDEFNLIYGLPLPFRITAFNHITVA
jgi:hypothetical protein